MLCTLLTPIDWAHLAQWQTEQVDVIGLAATCQGTCPAAILALKLDQQCCCSHSPHSLQHFVQLPQNLLC